MMARPQRWDAPFGPDMTDGDVAMLMGQPIISDMAPDRFPEHTPLAGILKNDTRLLYYRAGEIVVREGDYGNSAFLILEGTLRVVLAPNLPRHMIGRQAAREKNFFEALSQLWKNNWIPEVRDSSRYAAQQGGAHGKGAETHLFLQDIPAVLDKHRTAQLSQGALFGELAALGRVPRGASVFAETGCKLLEIRWQGLREIRKYDDSFRREIDQRYRDCPSSKYLGPLSLFHNGGSGSSWIDVKPLGADGSSGGFGWSVF